MADPVLLSNLGYWLGGYDFTGDLNSVNLSLAAAELDNKRFGDSVEAVHPGLAQVTAEAAGFFNAEDALAPDPVLWSRIDPAPTPAAWPLVYALPWSPTETPNTIGNSAYLVYGRQFAYSFGAAHGELLPFSVATRPASRASGANEYSVYRQLIARAKADTAVTETGAATQLGELTAAQRLVVSFHVFSIAGTGQWTLTIESDDGAGFGTPTNRMTFTSVNQADDPTSELLVLEGPIATDDFWRFVLTEDSGTSTINAAITWGINLI